MIYIKEFKLKKKCAILSADESFVCIANFCLLASHYKNMSMQYIYIVEAVKIENFQ